MNRLFLSFVISVLCVFGSGCSRDPEPEKLRFFLEATLDAHDKMAGEKMWEIANIKTSSEKHPAGRLIRFDATMRLIKDVYVICRQDELDKRGWKSLMDMQQTDPRFFSLPREDVARVINRLKDYRGENKDIVCLTSKQGEKKNIRGMLLANKAGDDWTFAKLELENAGDLNVDGYVDLPQGVFVVGTPTADEALGKIIEAQQKILTLVYNSVVEDVATRDAKADYLLKESAWMERCEKRCAQASYECESHCRRQFDRENPYPSVAGR